MKDYFPARLATGNRFCNRVREQALLKHNIELGRHMVLVSPRRYGKSSLVHKVVGDLKMPAAYIDFFMAHDDKAVTSRILQGVGTVLSQIIPVTHKTLQTLEKTFSRLKLSITVHGVEFSAAYGQKEFDAVAEIHDALKGLAAIAAKAEKRAVIFMDEFQDIINAEHSQEIQGALRSIAQAHDSIVFVFSGSSRHLLLDIFDDRKKPFYMLCDKLELERMTSEHYFSYVQKAAKEKWGKPIHDITYAEFIRLTELHPFYVNLLGNQLCRSEKFPNAAAVLQAWQECLEMERRRLVAEVEHLALNQQKVMKFLAQHPVTEAMSQAVLGQISLSSASMKQCLTALLQRDLIYQVAFEDPLLPLVKKGQYRVLDPLLAFSLNQY